MRSIFCVLGVLALAGCSSGGGLGNGSASDLSMSAMDAASVAPDLAAPAPDLAEIADLAAGTAGDMAAKYGCNGLFLCIQACKGMAACDMACRADTTKKGRALYVALEACIVMACPTSVPDGGTPPDSGVEPCSKPGSAECMTCRTNAAKTTCAKEVKACMADTP